MRLFLALFSFFILLSCSSEKTPKKEPKEEPKKEIKAVVLSEEEKFLLKLDKKQKDVYQNLTSYLSQLKSLNADKIVEMTYPKFFSIFSEHTFRGQIFTMANSSQIEIKSFNSKILNIEKVKPFSNGEFTQVSYRSKVIVYLKNPELYSTERSLNTLYSILVRKYGKKSIYVDVKERLITITKEIKMLAIKETPNSWKFIGDNPEYRVFYPSFLPYDILNNI
jgi:hypothetical protein